MSLYRAPHVTNSITPSGQRALASAGLGVLALNYPGLIPDAVGFVKQGYGAMKRLKSYSYGRPGKYGQAGRQAEAEAEVVHRTLRQKTKSAIGTSSGGKGYYSRGGRKKKSYRKRKGYKKRNYMPLNSITLKKEGGGTLNDDNAIYIGVHDSPVQLMIRQYCRTIVKELFKQFQVNFDDWSKTLVTFFDYVSITIRVKYFASESSNSVTDVDSISTLSGGATFGSVSENLAQTITTLMGVYQKRQIDAIELIVDRASITAREANIKLANFIFCYRNYAKIDVQNTTLASGGTTTETTNVTQNPVKGMVYRTAKSGFTPKSRRDQTAGFSGTVNTGLIFNTATTGGQAVDKPPLASYWLPRVTASPVRMNPGQIKSFSVVTSESLSSNRFFDKYHDDIAQLNANISILGHSVMIGLEKLLDNRGETSGVSISYENTLILKAGYKYKPKIYTVPVVDV